MKIYRLIVASLLFAGAAAYAQDAASLKASYERQVRMVGPAGVGVETILDRWEAADPGNPEVSHARFNLHFTKSRMSSVVPMPGPKYLGAAPVLSLKDSTGRDVYYYEVDFFDDEQFALSQTAIDKAISLAPTELEYRIEKINSLLMYEKESPDMAAEAVLRLADYNYNKRPAWTLKGESADADTFKQAIQEYCYTFYRYGTPRSYQAFMDISEKMHKMYPRETSWMSNLGSYYFVCNDAPRMALKWYDKVLKIKKDDYTAARNCVLVARRLKNTRLEKKSLPYLIESTQDDIEKRGYQIRLEALKAGK